MVAYGRFTEDEKIVVVVNSSETQGKINVPAWRLEVPMEATMTQLLYSYKDGYSTRKGEYQVKEGNLLLQMDKQSAIVLQYKK